MARWPAFAVLIALTSPALAEEPDVQGGAPLQLVWLDLAGVSPFAFEATTRRVRQAVAPAGLGVAWERREPSEQRAVGGVNVILLPGRAARPSWLGVTQRGAPGQASVWVYVGSVARALDLPRRHWASWSLIEQRELADALGIVVAHELVHVLAGPAHGESGVMAPRISPRDLRDRRLALAASDLRGPAGVALAARRTTP